MTVAGSIISVLTRFALKELLPSFIASTSVLACSGDTGLRNCVDSISRSANICILIFTSDCPCVPSLAKLPVASLVRTLVRL